MEEEERKPTIIGFKIDVPTNANSSVFNTLVLDLKELKNIVQMKTSYSDEKILIIKERNNIIEKMKMQLDYLKIVELGE